MNPTFPTRRHFLAGAAAASLAPLAVRADEPVNALMNRYPAQEVFAEAMKKTAGVQLNVQLMPNDKILELLNINLAAKSANFDIIPCNETQIIRYSRNGWILPLNDLWNKYKEQYGLGDIEENFVAGSSVDGTLYQLPNEFNGHVTMYRKDIYEAKGLRPEKTLDEFKRNAQSLKTDTMAGTVLMFRPGDQGASGATYYFNNVGDGWFHKDWRLAVNTPKGVQAVEFMKEMTKVAQRGFGTAAGDEGALALYQGSAAMGHMWLSRASSMDDPRKSRVVGKIGFAAPANGGHRITVSGLAISRFTKKDPDLLFRTMLETVRAETIRANIANNVPTRKSALNSTEFNSKYPYLVAAGEAAKTGKYYPAMPHFGPIADIVTRRIMQAMTDELKAKEAMDLAASEGNKYLLDNGWLKA